MSRKYFSYMRRKREEERKQEEAYWRTPEGKATAWCLYSIADPVLAAGLFVEIRQFVKPLLDNRRLSLTDAELMEILRLWGNRQSGSISFTDFFLNVIAARYPDARQVSDGWETIQARAYQHNGLGSYVLNNNTSNPESLGIGLASAAANRARRARKPEPEPEPETDEEIV